MIAFGVRKTATVTHRSRTATVMVYVREITSDSTTPTNDFHHHNPTDKTAIQDGQRGSDHSLGVELERQLVVLAHGLP